MRAQELDDLLPCLVLPQIDRARVLLRNKRCLPAIQLARVVRAVPASAHVAMHPQTAYPTSEERPQHVGVLAVFIVALCRLSHVVALYRRDVGPVEHLPRHKRLVRWFIRPHPLLGRVDPSSALSLSAVPHLIARGVSGVQDVPYLPASP